VDTFGGKPRFALKKISWYEGRDIENKLTVHEMFTQKEHRAQYAPRMFGFVRFTLWQQGSVLTVQ
jgi:hypothetical protein